MIVFRVAGWSVAARVLAGCFPLFFTLLRGPLLACGSRGGGGGGGGAGLDSTATASPVCRRKEGRLGSALPLQFYGALGRKATVAIPMGCWGDGVKLCRGGPGFTPSTLSTREGGIQEGRAGDGG